MCSGIQPPQPAGDAGSDEVGQLLRYCGTCQIWRGRRVKHCRVCNSCIDAFDHHCPWTGNCIGLRNYRYFVWFVIAVNLLSIVLTVLAGLQLVDYARSDANHRSDSDSFWNELTRAVGVYPAVAAMFVYCVLVWFTVVGLMHYHCDLIASALTTNEKIKDKFRHHPNPYDRGCLRNWTNLCCGEIPPSKLPDMHAYDD